MLCHWEISGTVAARIGLLKTELMTNHDDVFERLGETGPPLKDTIQQLLLRLEEDKYPPMIVVAAFSQVMMNLAAQLPDAENIEEVARAFEGYARQLRELHRPKPSAVWRKLAVLLRD